MAEEQKLAYQFNEITGEYMGIRFSQFYADQWLLPGSSTWANPPELAEHQVAVWADEAWAVKADYRGIPYWHKQSKQQFMIEEIDCYPDKDWTDQDPAKVDLQFTAWNEGKQRWEYDQAGKDRAEAEARAGEAEQYLRSTDWYVIRKAEKGDEIPGVVADARDAARSAIDAAELVAPGIKAKVQGAV